MHRREDKHKIAAKLVAESREHRGGCEEGDTQPAQQTLLFAVLTPGVGEIME